MSRKYEYKGDCVCLIFYGSCARINVQIFYESCRHKTKAILINIKSFMMQFGLFTISLEAFTCNDYSAVRSYESQLQLLQPSHIFLPKQHQDYKNMW